MKNINLRLILIIFVSLFFLQGCKNNPSSPSNNTGNFNIKGNFNSYSSLSVNKLDVPQAAKVIIYYTRVMSAFVLDVSNGSFSVQPFKDEPAGLVFADSSNHYLGYLTFGSGIDSLPLNMLKTDVTTIDLKSITITAGVAVPEYSPIGNEIPMTASDVSAYSLNNGIFATLLKNPDVDGDGIVDALENSFYKYFMTYFLTPGVFLNGTDLTPAISRPTTIASYSMCVNIHDPSGDPATIKYAGCARLRYRKYRCNNNPEWWYLGRLQHAVGF